MSDINIAAISGNLTRDPELRDVGSGESGTQVLRLRVACNTFSRQAENNQRANYLTVEVWGNRAPALQQLLRKGQKVSVQGSLRWSDYTKEGEESPRESITIRSTEVVPGRVPNGNGTPAPQAQEEEKTSEPADKDGVPF